MPSSCTVSTSCPRHVHTVRRQLACNSADHDNPSSLYTLALPCPHITLAAYTTFPYIFLAACCALIMPSNDGVHGGVRILQRSCQATIHLPCCHWPQTLLAAGRRPGRPNNFWDPTYRLPGGEMLMTFVSAECVYISATDNRNNPRKGHPSTHTDTTHPPAGTAQPPTSTRSQDEAHGGQTQKQWTDSSATTSEA
jgi:hypothetical protein